MTPFPGRPYQWLSKYRQAGDYEAVERWCQGNCRLTWSLHPLSRMVLFVDDQDALMFSLVWE